MAAVVCVARALRFFRVLLRARLCAAHFRSISIFIKKPPLIDHSIFLFLIRHIHTQIGSQTNEVEEVLTGNRTRKERMTGAGTGSTKMR
jgi:hypothetical protein